MIDLQTIDLQTSLIVGGVVFVVAVIAYNQWQEYKAKKNVERAFSGEHDDVLMTPDNKNLTGNEPRLEPTFVAARTGAEAQEDDSNNPDEFAPLVNAQKEEPIDPLIDWAIPLVLEGVVRGEKLLPALQSLRHIGNKPVHLIGKRHEGNWEYVAHGGVYDALQIGVQLANRNSPLNELEYSELVMRLRHVSDEIGAEPEFPDMLEVMSSARELHQFVSAHDAQVGVNIQSNGAPWAINTLLTGLEKQGFDLRPDGRFIMADGDGGILFSLSTNVTYAAETTSRLTLLLDVPCVAPLRDGFGAMVACAKSLAKRLDGVIVDDGNQILSDEALGEIAMQVNAFYDDMQAADIAAGSTRALRLFS